MNIKNNDNGPLVIAIDSSTTSTKAIIVDSSGNVLETAKRNIQLHTPAMDFYEHNPIRWWETTKASISEAVFKLSEKDRNRIAAIGITHQRESFAPFDKDGKPLRNGILWLDGRATKQIRAYGSQHVHDLSGKPPGVTPAIYKMAWVKENEPEIFEKSHKIVDVLAYITWNLTGRWASSVAAADSLGLLNIRKFDYSDELLNIAGVSREQMAELVPPGDVIEMLRPELVSEWKLSKSIPIIAGLGDGQAAGIGAAAVSPDVAYLNLGTAVNAGVESTIYKCDSAFRTHVSGIKGNFVFEALQSSGSYLAGWFRQSLGDPKLLGAPDPQLDALAEDIPPGCEGLVTLPYWNAVQSPYWDSVARGAIVGWRGTHSRAHMYRSILESIGFEMKLNLELIQKGTGEQISYIRAMGGGTNSKLWSQIMADIIGKPITVCLQDEISALGAAVLAMASTGVHGEPNIAKTAKEMVQLGKTIEPNKEKIDIYDEISDIQRQLYPQLRNVFEQLYTLSEKYPGPKPESPKAEL